MLSRYLCITKKNSHFGDMGELGDKNGGVCDAAFPVCNGVDDHWARQRDGLLSFRLDRIQTRGIRVSSFPFSIQKLFSPSRSSFFGFFEDIIHNLGTNLGSLPCFRTSLVLFYGI